MYKWSGKIYKLYSFLPVIPFEKLNEICIDIYEFITHSGFTSSNWWMSLLLLLLILLFLIVVFCIVNVNPSFHNFCKS